MDKKIFIIEDDANILYGLEAEFTSADFEVEVSEGEEEVDELIDLISDFDPSYIILDLILPKVDGFEIIKKIKENADLAEKQIFIFTDGIIDQFGGPKGKKYMKAPLKEKLLSMSGLSCEEQKMIIQNEFDLWKGSLDQVDDICVIGIRI